MGDIKSYRDLVVWQRAVDLAVTIYRVTEAFPAGEQFGLRSQIRRSAVSIPSNIAEGHNRPRQDFARFLNISRGSLAELETQLEISKRVDLISEEDYLELSGQMTILGKQLNSLLNRLKKQQG